MIKRVINYVIFKVKDVKDKVGLLNVNVVENVFILENKQEVVVVIYIVLIERNVLIYNVVEVEEEAN